MWGGRRRICAAVAVVVVFLGCAPPPTDALRTAPPPPRTLRVLAYNVQLLPLDQLNKRPDDAYRAAELGRRLAEYDVVGLSEVFEPRRRMELVEALRAAWQPQFYTATAPDWERTAWGLDGGLIFAGRLPIKATHWRAYGNGSSPLEFGLQADGFANKGVLHVRLARAAFAGDDAELDLFLTHLESRVSTVREAQYAMLAEFVAEHVSPTRPVVLLGDLNTGGSRAAMDDPQSQYHRLLNALAKARATWLDVGATIDQKNWGTMPADETEHANRIDYIFIANPTAGPVLKVRAAHVRRFADSRVKFLSDHAAVEAVLEW